MWSHCIDLLAPSISIPAPSAAAESAEPLATVISLSSILNSVEEISVAAPNTVKLPVTWTSPVKSPSEKVTLSDVDNPWLIPSSVDLFEWVCVSVSNESNLLSIDVERGPSIVSNLLSTEDENPLKFSFDDERILLPPNIWIEPDTTPPFKLADMFPSLIIISTCAVSVEAETISLFIPLNWE